jgi:Fe-S-cluster-containing hydrogenase component 2
MEVKDGACMDVCPVDCIYESIEQMFINPDECIDCGACVPACPVEAIWDSEKMAVRMGEGEYIEEKLRPLWFNIRGMKRKRQPNSFRSYNEYFTYENLLGV